MINHAKQSHCEPSTRTLRLGIAEYLGIAFAAVMILALAANLITHRSEVLRTQFVRTSDELPVAVRAQQPPTAALDAYHEAVIGALRAAEKVDREQLQRRAAALQRSVAAYAAAIDAPHAADLQRTFASYRAQAVRVLRADAARRDLLQQYADCFDAADGRVQKTLDGAWHIFGRVVARQSLLALQQSLKELHEQAARLSASPDIDEEQLQRLEQGEQHVATILTTGEGSLVRSQGEAWLATMQSEFLRMVELRVALVSATRAIPREQQRLERERHTFSGVLPQVLDAARQRSSKTTVTTHTTVKPPVHDERMLWLTGIVLVLVSIISAVTIYSVAKPVRRLVAATRSLARGDTNVEVPRGGLRELDGLAVAFNSMAAQLAQARAAVQTYQAQLERRVDERTRQLQHLAEHDPLTGLPNRRQLLSHIERSLHSAQGGAGKVALLFVDLDNFKTLNDSLGHVFGDHLLQAVSQRLLSAIPQGFCARWGGDEFTIVFDSLADAAEAWDRARAVLAAFDRPLEVGTRDIAISASVGASVFPDHAMDAEGLLRAADAALFRAKELGRRQAHLFSAELLETASSRFALEQALRRAVKLGEFELFYQPEISLDTWQPSAVEALLRWRHPDGRQVPPSEFLPIAEHTGLINDISDWVLRTAICTAARWHRGPWPQARIAVNLSSRQLLDQQLVQRIAQLLKEYELPAGCLEIELTENVLQTGAHTIATLRSLRELGLAIALDDFGTGYSSLTSLEQLPLTRVKIDRSLIASIDTTQRSASIARSIIGLCHSLGLEVTAEGIERPSQLARLLANRGLHVQGYLFAQPLSELQWLAYLESAPALLQQQLLELSETFEPESTGAHSLRRHRAVLNRAASRKS